MKVNVCVFPDTRWGEPFWGDPFWSVCDDGCEDTETEYFVDVCEAVYKANQIIALYKSLGHDAAPTAQTIKTLAEYGISWSE